VNKKREEETEMISKNGCFGKEAPKWHNLKVDGAIGLLRKE